MIMLYLSMKILLGIFGGYVVTSLILFKKPTLLYKKKRQHFVCRHISHRGGTLMILAFLTSKFKTFGCLDPGLPLF